MAYKFAESIQRGILYLLKSDKDFFLQIINLVKPEYFEYEAHKNIFKVVTNYYEKYKVLPTDHLLIQSVKDTFEKVTGSEYEDELEFINSINVESIDHKNYYLDLIEGFAKREALKLAISKSIKLLEDENFGDVELEIKKALSVNRDIDLGQDYFTQVPDRWARLSNIDLGNKIATPFDKINQSLEGGPARKELCMVVAPGGVGKSIYLVNQGVTALKENRKVLYVSLEMSEDRVAQRFDSIMSMIPQVALKTQQELLNKRLNLFRNEFPGGKLKIKEFPTGRANANTIRALINQLQSYEEFTPDVLIVDYLELLRPTNDGMPEYQAQERIAQELRGIGVEYNCLVWTATQTNREGAKVQVITDVNLADAYGKIRTCDFSMSLNQTDQEYDSGIMRAYVMKSRNGKQRYLFPINIDYNTLRMSNFDGNEDELNS
jgi:replicative DNA helicase